MTNDRESKSDSTSPDKKPRKRLKKLTADICQQMEFYFSDANLRKDRFLKQEMAKSADGYLNIDILANFNRIKAMTDNRKVIITALQQSEKLQVSEDKMLVRRREALKTPKYDPDDCTVYVECLPKKADHDWLRKAFSYCGKVVYISLPRYKSTGDLKGFAFVEFESPEEADSACELLNNPPPDVPLRAGKFPRTRGGRRVAVDESEVETTDDLVTEDRRQSREEQKLSSVKIEEDGVERVENKEEDAGKGEKTSVKEEDAGKGEKTSVKEEEEIRVRQKEEEEEEDKKRDGQKRQRQNSDDKGTKEKHKQKQTRSDSEEVKKGDREKRKREDSGGDDARTRDERKEYKRQHSSGSAEGVKAGEHSRRRRRHSEGNHGERRDGADRKRKHSGDDADRSEHSRRRRQHSEGSDAGREGKRKREPSSGDERGRRHISSETTETKKQKKHEHRDPEIGKDLKSIVSSKKEDAHHSSAKDGDIGDQWSEEAKGVKSESEKKKRSRKKKTRTMQEEEAIFLRVISKKEWLQLKHEYLALQKESLSRMKQSLREQLPASSYSGNAGTKAQPEKHNVPHVGEEQELATKYKATEPEFVAGTVMKLQCLKPVSRKEIKEQLENISPVAYVDLPEGHQEGFVRFESAEGPVSVLKKTDSRELSNLEFSLSLIAGEEEKSYWEKLRLDRINKLSSKQKKKKKRGVNRILKKAERAFPPSANSHMRFDD